MNFPIYSRSAAAQTMQRQFLNIVVREHDISCYALHRIRLSKNLFYEATENTTAQEVAKAQEAARAKKKNQNRGWPSKFLSLRRLPKPEIFFSAQPSIAIDSHAHFFSLLPALGEGCVMFTDPSGNASIYDVDMQSVVAMPQAKSCKPANSITLSVNNQRSGTSQWSSSARGEHGLYVMSTDDGSSFELFNYSSRTDGSAFANDWSWQSLPPVPPCVHQDPGVHYSYYNSTTVHPVVPPFAAAVVDSSTICASSSSMEGGTYALDTFRGVWRQAGRWTLPFHGAAEYVPEFRLWFGLEDPQSSSQHRLCAFDLASSAMADSAPASQNAWDYLDGLPAGWGTSERRLVNLGMGKFCIATHCFQFHRPSPDMEEADVVNDRVTVLTGVEVVRAGDGLQMIKHKSRHYSHENLGIHCVL